MDIQMPVLDGYEAPRPLKADPAVNATPIIAVSSFAMRGDEEKARAAGCDHYVIKPYGPLPLWQQMNVPWRRVLASTTCGLRARQCVTRQCSSPCFLTHAPTLRAMSLKTACRHACRAPAWPSSPRDADPPGAQD